MQEIQRLVLVLDHRGLLHQGAVGKTGQRQLPLRGRSSTNKILARQTSP
jgi:hypothetical protein